MQTVSRPKAPTKKIDCHEEFELCYLRHQYLRRVTWNPTEEQMAPFYSVVKHIAKKTFFTYYNLFQLVGFESEDLVNIGKIHLVSYLGLFSVVNVPEKYDQFIDIFHKRHRDFPESEDFLNKEKANFTLFLKQRMEDVVRVCRQKAKNIKGSLAEEYMVFVGPVAPPENLRELAENHRSFGYKRMDISNFKRLKKLMKNQKGPIYEYKGNYYVCVDIEHRTLSLVDFVCAGLDPREAIHNMTPEEYVARLYDQREFEKKKEAFFARSENYRIRKIKEFISLHKNDPRYTEEVRTARKLLKDKSF